MRPGASETGGLVRGEDGDETDGSKAAGVRNATQLTPALASAHTAAHAHVRRFVIML